MFKSLCSVISAWWNIVVKQELGLLPGQLNLKYIVGTLPVLNLQLSPFLQALSFSCNGKVMDNTS